MRERRSLGEAAYLYDHPPCQQYLMLTLVVWHFAHPSWVLLPNLSNDTVVSARPVDISHMEIVDRYTCILGKPCKPCLSRLASYKPLAPRTFGFPHVVSAVCCKDYGSLDFSQRAPAISLIDDDRLVREAIERFIRSLGYNIDVFASGEDFLAFDNFRTASCIITDIHMPGISGIELQKRLLDEGYSIPIIFMSASYTEMDRARTQQAGAVGLLTKPFHVESLTELLAQALKEK